VVGANPSGVLDLVVTLSIGVWPGPGHGGSLKVTPSTEPLGLLPSALVPTGPCPPSLAPHIGARRRLRTTARPTQDRDGQLVAAGS
jgi:hypothetical protein